MIHVCFSFRDKTGSFAKFAGTAMLSAFENISMSFSSITVHVLHDNTLTNENRSKFSYLAGRYGQTVKFYNVEELRADKIAQMINIFSDADKARFNQSILYKFLIPQILPNDIDKVIYFEPSVIVNLDVNELWRINLGDKMLGVVPALAIGSDIHAQDKIVADGFVKKENYFNSGVMLMNLKLLRVEEKKILEGLHFANEHQYINLLDQTVLNYCFSTQTVKLPAHFNSFVRLARSAKETVTNKIYYYTGYSLQLDMNEPFNALWMEYFAKTPWFDAAAIGKLYESFQQVYNRLKKSMTNLSITMNGKTRGFCATPNYVDDLKKLFRVRNDEEFIVLNNQAALQNLLKSMKKSRGKKIFYIMAKDFNLGLLTKVGFNFGADFLNALEFLSGEQGMSMNSYPLLYSM